MITSAYISKLRRQFSDMPKLHKDTRDGDGSSTVYKSKFSPIKEGTATVQVSGAFKTENTDFTLDYDTGDLRMTVAPASGSDLDLVYKEVNFRDQHWLDAIADGYRAMGDQIFGTVIMNTSSLRLSAGIRTFSAPSNCIRMLSIFECQTSAGTYTPIRTNWEYNRQANKFTLGNAKSLTYYAALTYLTKITAPSAVTMAMTGEENWHPLITHKAGAYYLRAQAEKIAQQGNATIEEGHFNPAVLRALANDHDAQFEILRHRVKPVMPALDIKYWNPSAGSLP